MQNVRHNIFLQASTFCFQSLAIMVICEMFRAHKYHANVGPDILPDCVNPLLYYIATYLLAVCGKGRVTPHADLMYTEVHNNDPHVA